MPCSRATASADGKERDLGEFILLYAITATVRIALVGLPGIAQVRRCDWGGGRRDGDVGNRQLLGFLRIGNSRERHDRHRRCDACPCGTGRHDLFAGFSQIADRIVLPNLQ